jgi:hypothetical protein
MAAARLLGNLAFRHFEPQTPWWRRLLKAAAARAIAAAISYYFGRTGGIVWFTIAAVPMIYVHGFWLPRHGVNGWTGEPRVKYYALRG